MEKSVLICFLGMDGSGKSTLSSFLTKELKKHNYFVIHRWWLEAENSIIRKIMRYTFNLIHNPVQGNNEYRELVIHDENKLLYWIYPKIVFVNYLFFGISRVKFPLIFGKKKILIFDRYYPDTLWSLKREFDLNISNMLDIFEKMLPEPDLIFLIEITPEVALERKKVEILTIENSRKIWEEHCEMHDLIIERNKKSIIIRIDNEKSIKLVENRIINIVLKDLNNFTQNN